MSEQPDPALSLDRDIELVHADFDRPSIARIYDYHLGGNANFDVDRTAGDELERVFPDQLAYCRYNRGFLRRAVHALVAEHGIDQFLDLGSGVPTVGNVHEIAHQINPDARIAYVDWEAIAVHHARRLLGADETRITVTQADVQDPTAVLANPGVSGLLDFTRPVAVLALGILDIIPMPDGAGLISQYRDACCRGSALAVSNGAQLTTSEVQVGEINELLADSTTPGFRWRTRTQVSDLLPGYELLEPGVVPTAAWRPEHPVAEAEAARANAYAAVGILP